MCTEGVYYTQKRPLCNITRNSIFTIFCCCNDKIWKTTNTCSRVIFELYLAHYCKDLKNAYDFQLHNDNVDMQGTYITDIIL